MSRKIRLGVVGVGAFGANHCRVGATIRDVELAGVHDVDAARAAGIAERFETSSFPSFESLLDAVDAVVIATPTSTHAELAIKALERGRHVLVEKPIALSMDSARRIAEAARRAGLVCAVGHVERHNATFSELQGVLRGERPLAVRIRRLNYFVPRVADADVTLDLLIHDVDLLLALTGERPSTISATGLRVVTDVLDHVDALVAFPSGVVAVLTASRFTEDTIRTMEVTARGRYLVANLLRRTLTLHRRVESRWETGGPDVKLRVESVMERVHVPAIEPLHCEIEDFARAIIEERPPLVTVEDGIGALEVVLEVRRQAEAGVSALSRPR